MLKVTYQLESDEPMVLKTYKLVNSILQSFEMDHFPNVEAITKELSQGNKVAKGQLRSYAISCVKPGFKYFTDTFASSLSDALKIFKVARFFDPHKIREINPSAASIDDISIIPFLKSSIASLKDELPLYLSKVKDLSLSLSPLEWWQAVTDLPSWSTAVRKILLIQPTSASSERAFSLLKNSFGTKQNNSLNDYMEASVFLQYNYHS